MGTLIELLPGDSTLPGVVLQELKVIPVAVGDVLHMLRSDSPLFSGFGEMYFSTVEHGAVKAWKRHLRQTQCFAVPSGRVKLVLYDNRQDSEACGTLATVTLGLPDTYWLLRVPPLIWYGFSGIAPEKSLLANCADIPHDPAESERLPFDDTAIPYRW